VPRISFLFRAYPPHYELGSLLCCRDAAEMVTAAHSGAFRNTFLMWKSSLKSWLTQSLNVNSHDAVLDLFLFYIELYLIFKYYVEFTFAIQGFLSFEKKTRTFGIQHGDICPSYSVFWRVTFIAGLHEECSELFALAPIAFILLFTCHYTHIKSAWCVDIWDCFIITNILVFFTEKEAICNAVLLF